MVVFIYSNPTDEIRGKTRRYLYEIKPNVFCGNISAKVRDLLWKKIEEENVKATILFSANNEQGFEVKTTDPEKDYSFSDFEGIFLSTRHKKSLTVDDLLAKPDVKLIDHILDTGAFAEMLLLGTPGKALDGIIQNCKNEDDNVFLKKENIISSIAFLSAFHDLGKCSPWQRYIASKNEAYKSLLNSFNLSDEVIENFRHERYSVYLISEYFKERNLFDPDMNYAAIIGYHHQGKSGSLQKESEKEYPCIKPEWKNLQKQLINQVETRWSFSEDLLNIRKCRNGFTYFVLCVMNVADWMASSEKWLNYKKNRSESRNDLIKSFLIENKTFGQNNTKIVPEDFEKIFGFNPNDMQVKTMELAEKGFSFMLIESCCGTGKTEAAQMASLINSKGLYNEFVAMPTISTAKAIKERIRDIYKNLGADYNIPEFDSSAIWSENEMDHIDKDLWASSSRQHMLYPTAVGTIDQVFEAISYSRYSMLNLLGLCGKTLILDEIHSYDVYMLEELKTLIKWCKFLNIPVILLSATLATSIKKELFKAAGYKGSDISMDYPLISIIKDGVLNQKSAHIEGKTISYKIIHTSDVASYINERQAKLEGCTEIILDSVDNSIKVFDTLKSDDNILFHSRDTLENKNTKILKILDKYGKNKELRPIKSEAVATSIIAQSIDVDFDNALISILPIDMIIQILGRVCRHKNKGTIRENGNYSPIIEIIIPEDISLAKRIFSNDIIERTIEILEKNNSFNTITDLRSLIDYVYNSKNTLSSKTMSEEETFVIKKPDISESMTELSDASYNNFSKSKAVTREQSYPTTQIAIVSEEELVQLKNPLNSFESAKEIYTKKIISVATNKLENFDEYIKGEEINSFLDHIRLYISSTNSIEQNGSQMILSPDKGLLWIKE